MIMLILSIFLLVTAILVVAIAIGGPREPPPMESVNQPFDEVDDTDLAEYSHFSARDGTQLGYRFYAPQNSASNASVVLIHGSSSSSRSMHTVAQSFAGDGYNVYALDIRGHGASGTKGQIDYIGQLEDDMEDFMAATGVAHPATLVGFSSGGGFVLRFAGDNRSKLFSNFLLLSPFISARSPTYRPNSGGWVNVGVLRIIVLQLFNKLGIKGFNRLAVINFALDEDSKKSLTPYYSYSLLMNFQPLADYKENIRLVTQPLQVLAGQEDEVFKADQFEAVFTANNPSMAVTLVRGINHAELVLEPRAIEQAVNIVSKMNSSA